MNKGRKWLITAVALMILSCLCVACSNQIAVPDNLPYGDLDLSQETAAGLESAARYKTRFKNGDINIGDVMPYYHDGIYSFFYLAETGSHPVYRADTTDFVNFEDKGEVLAAGAPNAQDAMIGTGSIVKAGNDYYFFYTGFKKDNPEAIMLAKSSGNIDDFVKVTDFIIKAADVNGCDLEGRDLRDPEAYYDEENERFVLLVSARRSGEPVIAKFTVSLDLSVVTYEGVIYSDARPGANVLECSDLFRMGDKWYLTYSVQDVSNGGNDGANSVEAELGSQGKVFYAVSDGIDGPFERVYDAALDSHAFYAAKSIQDGANTYLAGWIRQKNSNIGWQYLWGGNLQVHQLTQNADGSLNASLPQSVRNYYSVERKLDGALEAYNGFDMIAESKDYHTVSAEYPEYLLHATASFDADTTEFGFALGVSSNTANIMEVAFVPHANKMRSSMAGRQELCSKNIRLIAGEEYDVTLLVEGSAVTVYVNDSVAFSSRIRNIGNKKLAVFAKGGSVTMKDFHLYTPSNYADTLSSGYGDFTVYENGEAKKGNVNKLNVSSSAPARAEYVSPEDNFLRCTAAVCSDKAVNVKIKLGNSVLKEYGTQAGKVSQTSVAAYAVKGDKLTVEFTSDEDAVVWTNVSVETDKRAFAAETKAEIANDGTASYTAGESGVYEYVATMYYAGEIIGEPVFEAGESGRAAVTNSARLLTLRGAVKLNAGEKFDVALRYGKFVSETGAHNIVLAIRGGGNKDTFAAGIGTYTKPVSVQSNVVSEIVPMFENIEFSGIREMSVEMNGDVFGEQGKCGFVYAYGKAGDELKPMTEYNTNGETWEYKHKAPEANDALEIKADYMKQGGDYVTAVIWVAPADGYIDFVADYESHTENVQVQAFRNRTLLYDVFLKDAGRADIALLGTEVKSGDCIILAVRAAGRSTGESDGNYHIKIGKGNSTVPFDPSAPVIADYAADYNTERQGDYGWKYATASYGWGPERIDGITLLGKSGESWSGGGASFDAHGKATGNLAAILWENYTSNKIAVHIQGSFDILQPTALRVWIVNADGTGKEKVQEIFADTAGKKYLRNAAYSLDAGEKIAFVLCDVWGSKPECTADIRVATKNGVIVNTAAFDGALNAARAITNGGNSDGTYTEESFAALETAVNAANEFAPSISEKSYAEISEATKALETALNGLKLDTRAAREELENYIAEVEHLENLGSLVGKVQEFKSALSAARNALANEGATSEQLTEAKDFLEAARANVAVSVADNMTDNIAAQGDCGWIVAKVGMQWNPQKPTGYTELTKDGTVWKSGGDIAIDESGNIYGNEVAYMWRNYGGNVTLSVRGKVTVKDQNDDTRDRCIRVFVWRNNGNHERIHESFFADSNEFAVNNMALAHGEMVMFIVFDNHSAMTLDCSIEATDVVTIDKTSLTALVTNAAALNAEDYTEASFDALTAAKKAAQSVLNKDNATAGEMYRAETALQTAIAQLESAQLAEILQGNNGWTVVSADIEWSSPSKLKDIKNVQFENGKFSGNGVTVQNSSEGKVLVSSNGGVAIVYTAMQSGTYVFEGNLSGTRGNGRFYEKKGEASDYTELGFFGDSSAIRREITLQAGESLAIHFEGPVSNMLMYLSAQPSSAA